MLTVVTIMIHFEWEWVCTSIEPSFRADVNNPTIGEGGGESLERIENPDKNRETDYGVLGCVGVPPGAPDDDDDGENDDNNKDNNNLETIHPFLMESVRES